MEYIRFLVGPHCLWIISGLWLREGCAGDARRFLTHNVKAGCGARERHQPSCPQSKLRIQKNVSDVKGPPGKNSSPLSKISTECGTDPRKNGMTFGRKCMPLIWKRPRISNSRISTGNWL